MIGIPAVRHSDTGQKSPLGTFIYRLVVVEPYSNRLRFDIETIRYIFL